MSEPRHLSYCAAEVRRHDHDRFLTALFAPLDRREALFALYAFNLEIAKTAETVSEPVLGQIRLQWWHDSLAEVYDRRPRQHAVVQALDRAVRVHQLDRPLLERLIAARAFDLDPDPPANLAELEGYAKDSSATLMALAGQILGSDLEEVSQFTRHLGLAWACTGLLRAIPYHARQKRLYLPTDMCQAYGLDFRAFFELRGGEPLANLVRDLAGHAADHLASAQGHGEALPKTASSLQLYQVLAASYLKDFARVGYDPFDPRLSRARPTQIWRLALARLRRRY